MSYRVGLCSSAERDLKRVPRRERGRLVHVIRSLAEDPLERPDVVSVKGKPGFWRVRTGDYRIIFSVVGDQVEVALIGHRREVYEMTRRRL